MVVAIARKLGKMHMDMIVGWRLLLAPMLLVTAMTAQAGNTTGKTDDARESEAPLFIRTEAAIQVDASGHVMAVELDPELPAALRSYADKVIRDWAFAPVMQDGRAVGGKTYADVDMCLMPVGDHFNVGLDYAGNGPGNADADADRRVQTPPFPVNLLSPHARAEVKAQVRYRIGVDGRATLVSATFEDMVSVRHERSWHRQVREWLRTRRFKPEIIDGQPTETLMEFSVEFRLKSAGTSDDDLRREYAKHLAGTDACQLAASAPEQREVAVDSRFVLVPDA